MTSIARSVLLRQLVQEMFPERYIEFTALEASSTTELQALALRHADASENSLDPGWVYIDGGVSIGDERGITGYDPRAAATYGTITPHRPFTTDLASTSVGFVYTGGLSPSQLIAHLNASLRRSRRQRLLPLTLLPDGNMEDIDDGPSWTLVNATGGYGAGTLIGDNLPSDGSKSYIVLSTDANGYAESIALRAVPGERINAEATGRMTTATGASVATFTIYDKTNSAVIASVTTSSRQWVRMPLEVTIPAGCFSISFRLSATLEMTASSWDEVLYWRPETTRFPVLNEVVRGNDILDVFQRKNRSKDAEGNYHADDFDLIRLPGWEVRVDERAVAPVVLELARSGWSRSSPILVECLLPYDALALDTDTTGADRDDIILRAKALAFAQLARSGPGENRKFYRQEADLLARTWATAASRQPRPARPIKGPRSSGAGASTRRWWR